MFDTTAKFVQESMRGFALYAHQELKLVPERHYRVTRVIDTPKVASVFVAINPKLLSPLQKIDTQLSMAMGFPEGMTVNISRHHGYVIRLELPKPENLVFGLCDKDLPPGRRQSVNPYLGIDVVKELVTANFGASTNAHALVAGMTGSGKTEMIQMLVAALSRSNSPRDLQFFIVDEGKGGRRLSIFNGKAHLAHPVITEFDEALQCIAFLVKEMERRKTLQIADADMPHLFLVIDELADLLDQDKESRKWVITALKRLGQKAREFKIHVIVGTQFVTLEDIGPLRRNLGLKLVGRVEDSTAADTATGRGGTGAERLLGEGDFIIVDPTNRMKPVIRFQAAQVSQDVFDILPPGNNSVEFDSTDCPIHIIESSVAGRPPDPLEPDYIANMVVRRHFDGPPSSEYTIEGWCRPDGRRVNINKARRHYEIAGPVYDKLVEAGIIDPVTGEEI
jgi:hypothetical protein